MNSSRRAVAFSLVAKSATFSLHFVTVIALSRLLTPGETGIYSVAASFAGIVHAIREFGLTGYLVAKEDVTRSDLESGFGVGMTIALILAVAVVVASGPLGRFYGNEGVTDVLRVLSLSLLLSPFGVGCQAMLTRQMQFGTFLWLSLLSTTVYSATSIVLASNGVSYMSVAWASVLQSITVAALFSLRFPNYFFLRPRLSGWRPIMSWGLYSSGANVVSLLGINAPDFILGRTMGFSAVAYFSRANGLLNVFREIFQNALIPVMLPIFSTANRSGELKEKYLLSVTLFTGVAWPVYTILALAAPQLVLLMFGPQWAESVPVAQVLCIGGIVSAPMALSGTLLTALGVMRGLFKREVLLQGIRVLLILAASLHGLVTVAAAVIAVQVTSFIVNYILLRRELGLGLGELLAATSRSAIVAVLTFLVPFSALGVGWIARTPDFFDVLLIAGLSLAAWVLSVLVVRHLLRSELETVVRRLTGWVGINFTG